MGREELDVMFTVWTACILNGETWTVSNLHGEVGT